MPTSKSSFLRDFGRALADRRAALFVGAGLSRPAGYVDWRGLLKEIAEDLGLEIDRETDLLSVAQFHENRTGNRAKLNQVLLSQFAKGATPTQNHALIASLPVASIWTTNYDTLIEDALRSVGRRPDVKHSTTQLAVRVGGADVTVYKMHGDVSVPDEAVLTRDDYETYSEKRQLFAEKLQGDLVSETFLFLGFSFGDPNIDHVLSRIRVLLGRAVRNHFCVMKKPTPGGDVTDLDAEYQRTQLGLRIQDLKRYGIQTVLVDDYSEIAEMLEQLNRAAHARDVFVSGSARDYGSFGEAKTRELCRELGKAIIADGLNLVSGFGLGIGGDVAMAAIEEVYCREGERLEARVLLRPFPQVPPSGQPQDAMRTKYREDMIRQAGCAVFLCGNKRGAGTRSAVKASGVREEFDIAKGLGRVLIPVAATGFVAEDLWNEMSGSLREYFGSVDVSAEFDALRSDDVGKIVKAIMGIIRKASGG